MANFVPRHVRHLDWVVTGHLAGVRDEPTLLKAFWAGSRFPFPRLSGWTRSPYNSA